MYSITVDVVRPFEDRRNHPTLPGDLVSSDAVTIRDVAAEHSPEFVAALLNLHFHRDSLEGETWSASAYAAGIAIVETERTGTNGHA